MTIALTAEQWVALESDPTKDKAYLGTALGPAVSDYLARRDTEGLADRTLDTYERDLARLAVRHPHKGPADFSVRELHDFLAIYPRDSRPRVRASVRAFFSRLELDGIIAKDPSRHMPPIRQQTQRIIDVFTEAEQDMLTYGPRDQRDRALARLLLTTGLRKAEACQLELRDIDLDGRRLSVRRGKGRKGRVIPFPFDTAAAIADLATLDGLNRADHVWYVRYVNEHGETVRHKQPGAGSFHRWWERTCDQAGVRYRNAHVCRHTYATTLLRRRVPMASVSRLLGHASIRTTVDLYGHLAVEDLAADVDAAYQEVES